MLVDNDMNKVHRKFPLDMCLINLKYFGLAFVLFKI